MRISVLLLIIVSFVACNHSDDLSMDPSLSKRDLIGVWAFSEEGFSPGSGYVVRPVTEVPPPTIKFSVADQFTATVRGMEQYTFYNITTDQKDNLILTLSKSIVDPLQPADPSRSEYQVEFEGNKLKLIPLFPSMCIEGCHFGFTRFVSE